MCEICVVGVGALQVLLAAVQEKSFQRTPSTHALLALLLALLQGVFVHQVKPRLPSPRFLHYGLLLLLQPISHVRGARQLRLQGF